MKNAILTSIALLYVSAATAYADDCVTLIAAAPNSSSSELTLGQGDSAELSFCSYDGFIGRGPVKVGITVGENTFDLSAIVTTSIAGAGSATHKTNPIKIAGPASIRLKVDSTGGAWPAFATFNVHRAGTATAPVPIPQEAGTTWQVILEASSDLVNWTAVQPGDYPSSTPQRYFRTRLVKRS